MRIRLTVLLGSLLLVGTGCATGPSTTEISTGTTRTATPSGSVSVSLSVSVDPPPTTNAPTSSDATPPPPPKSKAQQVLDTMSLAERVGQLMMVDCPSTQLSSQSVEAIQRLHVGSVILDGTSHAGLAATAEITSGLERSNPSPAKLFIASDQEGGLVQRLQGEGFSDIPSAVVQGGYAAGTLQSDWKRWGGELKAAGVNVNLAPVLDTVPAGFGSNPPIGDLDRQYGNTPKAVTTHGIAAAEGLRAAGVAPTVKHFPGLGRTRGNTDTTGGVVDSVTTPDDPYLAPFAAAVDAEVPFVMMSTAVYSKLDPDNPAAFSPTIIGHLLRSQLGFTGIVISDDIGAAAQVAALSPGERAVAFVAAGGDIVLTVDPSTNQPMVSALVARAKSDPAFRRLVDAAALRVLTVKEAFGLLN